MEALRKLGFGSVRGPLDPVADREQDFLPLRSPWSSSAAEDLAKEGQNEEQFFINTLNKEFLFWFDFLQRSRPVGETENGRRQSDR